MLSVNQAPDSIAEVGPQWGSKRIIAQPFECRVETAHVDFGYVLAEPRDAELVDLNQVRFCSIREFNLSHALPCDGR